MTTKRNTPPWIAEKNEVVKVMRSDRISDPDAKKLGKERDMCGPNRHLEFRVLQFANEWWWDNPNVGCIIQKVTI